MVGVLISTTVIIWNKRCRGRFNMEDIRDVQIWSAKQIVENIPMTMAELIKMETN